MAYFPVGLFAAVMGIGGLSLAWRRAGAVLGLPHWPSQVLFWIAAAVFVLVASLYLTKWVRYPAAARAETRHPIQLAFVPTLTIGLLVLATAGQDLMPQVARVAWWVGAVGHLTLTVAILSAWFRRPEIVAGTITPAWFIPIVGNVVTPLAAPAVGSTEFAWFAFGVGLLLWIAFLPLVLQRILTHDAPLPPRLTPTLAVFIAPPAMTMLSWQSLTGRLDDPMSRILYAVTITFVVLLAVQAERLLAVPFAVPAWAYTFPLTAAAAAALAFAGAHPLLGYRAIAGVLLVAATLVVLLVAALTLRAAARRQICVPG